MQCGNSIQVEKLRKLVNRRVRDDMAQGIISQVSSQIKSEPLVVSASERRLRDYHTQDGKR